MSTPGYRPRRPPQTGDIVVRGLRHRVLRWPGRSPEPLLLLHGWMDTGATYQFLVDELSDEWSCIAFDWRGFGGTAWAPEGYWFPDYYADLEALIDALCIGTPATLVAHSMGGNVALQYAGLRPRAVGRLVCIEGFGLPRTTPDQAPARLRRWLDELREPPEFARFASFEALAAYLARRHPRLGAERADFVARAWAEPDAAGGVRMRGDPAHKRANPVLYRREESEACWRDIEAAVLYVIAAESGHLARLGGDTSPGGDASVECMSRLIRRLEPCEIAGAGHMVHHEQPAALAAAIDAFLRRT